ncbi:YbaY family lipoprotein [Cryobacterium sp. TMT1-66-1]|uniref:YbaY family lipoprotein n=1 Tax=Cryobacterium sp. TMT1-66-1 TaxID=1259242 RepID=UPI00106D8E0F|nr:YbaY family lipoprotein [Cryobacterium sp. TMT1-66-1]TFD03453.1 hypothetical protein E3T29_16525 [Cryobacterium sp. TMT1-66-1]
MTESASARGESVTLHGVVEFAPEQRPQSPCTVTVLVEDVSKADAPSTIVGRSRFQIPAPPRSELSDRDVNFAVTVPADALDSVRRLNVRVHVSARMRREPDVTERPDITEGDFVSTQSHPVLPDPVLPGLASVRVPVLRV